MLAHASQPVSCIRCSHATRNARAFHLAFQPLSEKADRPVPVALLHLQDSLIRLLRTCPWRPPLDLPGTTSVMSCICFRTRTAAQPKERVRDSGFRPFHNQPKGWTITGGSLASIRAADRPPTDHGGLSAHRRRKRTDSARRHSGRGLETARTQTPPKASRESQSAFGLLLSQSEGRARTSSGCFKRRRGHAPVQCPVHPRSSFRFAGQGRRRRTR